PEKAAGGQLARESLVASPGVLARPIADPGRLASLLDRPSGMDLLFDGLGGAVGRVDVGATAFPHRSALGTVQVYVSTDSAHERQSAQDVAEMILALGDLAGTGAYVNYIDPELPGWASAYYGPNLGRPRQIAY